jgi:hypothetical protein
MISDEGFEVIRAEVIGAKTRSFIRTLLFFFGNSLFLILPILLF